MEATAAHRTSRRKSFLILSGISLAVAGLFAAIGVLVGGDSWKSVATAGLIFSLNILVLVSFTAAHSWLKISQRAASGLAVVGSLFFLWVDIPYSWELSGDQTPPLAILRDWTSGSWIAVTALSIICLLSLCWKYLRGSVALSIIYALSLSFALGSAAVFWLAAGISQIDSPGNITPSLAPIGSALAILATAASLIAIVASFVERGKARVDAPSAYRAPAPVSDLKVQLTALAQSGELLEIILQSPDLAEKLRSELLRSEPSKMDGPGIPDSAV